MPYAHYSEMPITAFRTTFAPAYGDTWVDAEYEILRDPADAFIVSQLREILKKEGTFEEPVVVAYDEDEQLWRVSNGMHRVVASWLEGAPKISYYELREDEEFPYPETQLIEAEFKLYNKGELITQLSEIFGWFRSMPVGKDNIWVTSDIMSLTETSGVFSGLWYVPVGVEEAFLNSLKQRARHIGCSFNLEHMRSIPVEDG